MKHIVREKAEHFHVHSAGVAALDGYSSSAETIRVMREHGIDVSGHKSRHLTGAMVRAADLIIVMEWLHKNAILQNWPEASEKTHLLTEYSSHGKGKGMEIDIPDPIRMPENFYKNVFQVIRECVLRIAEEMGIPREGK